MILVPAAPDTLPNAMESLPLLASHVNSEEKFISRKSIKKPQKTQKKEKKDKQNTKERTQKERSKEQATSSFLYITMKNTVSN